MNRRMKTIIMMLLMVIFATLIAGCESQDDKIKRLESEMEKANQTKTVELNKALEAIDAVAWKNTAREYIKKQDKLIEDFTKTAKGNAEYELKAEKWNTFYRQQKRNLLELVIKSDQQLKAQLQSEKFKNLQKKLQEVSQGYYDGYKKFHQWDFWRGKYVTDPAAFQKVVNEYADKATPILAEMTKTAEGNQDLMKNMVKINENHEKRKNGKNVGYWE